MSETQGGGMEERLDAASGTTKAGNCPCKSLREDEVEDLAVGRGEILCQSETSDMRLSSLTWHGRAVALESRK